MKGYVLFLIFTLSLTFSWANEDKKDNDKDDDDPIQIGNFSLPSSQQPYGLFAFGGNVIDKGELQFFLFGDKFNGKDKVITDLIPSVLYGINNSLSIYFVLPYLPKMEDSHGKSSGLGDVFVQLEYAIYNKKGKTFNDQATIVANISAPTGSVTKDPNTGLGSYGAFIGGTYIHMTPLWFAFTGQGAILSTSHKKTRIGNQFLYQFGLGRNICSPKGWIYAWMFEIDGQYSWKNKFKGIRDNNSGGNIIFATPSIWISSKNFLAQFGFSIPIAQKVFGKQTKIDYGFNINLGWSLY